MGSLYKLQTPANYTKDSGCYEVLWVGVFMPFDVICGLDSCPPDNHDYSKNSKNHWWVCPKTKNRNDISAFIHLPTKEFDSLQDAIQFCVNWRKDWLEKQIKTLN